MAIIQPVLTLTELAFVDQTAALTGSKRTDVIKIGLRYITGSRARHWL